MMAALFGLTLFDLRDVLKHVSDFQSLLVLVQVVFVVMIWKHNSEIAFHPD